MTSHREQSYKNMLASARMPTREGFLYEPRGFWSYGRFDTLNPVVVPGGSPGVVPLPLDHFYNGESYPVTLLYALITPLNYTWDLYAEPGQPPSLANYRNCGVAALSDSQISLGVRHRQNYARIAGLLQTLSPRPRWDSEWVNPQVIPDDPTVKSTSRNVYRWDFDAAMVVPNKGNLEFEISRYTLPSWLTIVNDQVTASIGFQEIGALPLKGAGRFDGFNIQSQVAGAALNNPFTLYGADGFGFNANGQGQGAWNPTQRFSAKDFSAQNQSSDGSTPITGFGVMIDQAAYDASIVAQKPAATGGGSTIASLGSRLGTRARMRQGGSGAWWWREGAPLALVSPHRTPALVHELQRPLTLGPGDNLEVELTFPLTTKNAQGVDLNRVTQVGVSFLGYAAIEG